MVSMPTGDFNMPRTNIILYSKEKKNSKQKHKMGLDGSLVNFLPSLFYISVRNLFNKLWILINLLRILDI